MKKVQLLSLITLFLFVSGLQAVSAQSSNEAFRDLFQMQFDNASRVLQLAEVMPEDTYDWRPDEGVRSVGEVYTHIASANIFFLQNVFGINPPAGIDMSTLDSLTDKEEIVNALRIMTEHVQESVAEIPDSALDEPASLFGMNTNGQGILSFLISHMSEHYGQSIAYARMNGVTPPWSE